MIEKYVGSVINLANGFGRACNIKRVGQMSELIKEYRLTADTPTEKGWKDFYYKRVGKPAIKEAADVAWDTFLKIRKNMDSVEKKDIYNWIHDLIITKTFSGMQIQLDILEMLAEDDYRLATPEEEAKGIDGYIDGEPVSIKPNTYKKTINSNIENIPYRIIYYKKTKNGIVVVP